MPPVPKSKSVVPTPLLEWLLSLDECGGSGPTNKWVAFPRPGSLGCWGPCGQPTSAPAPAMASQPEPASQLSSSAPVTPSRAPPSSQNHPLSLKGKCSQWFPLVCAMSAWCRKHPAGTQRHQDFQRAFERKMAKTDALHQKEVRRIVSRRQGRRDTHQVRSLRTAVK